MVQEISQLNMKAVEEKLKAEDVRQVRRSSYLKTTGLGPHVDRPLERAIEFMKGFFDDLPNAI